ncbi:DUF6571 family protein [Streptomyces sp. URMC 129]|uniref:DUF6571 family protein n=1 Tax=Streptomyces sp. URMC 129 TaxID=3423407 RepID=UPI003F1AA76F
MTTYQQLRDLSLTPLEEAVETWRSATDELSAQMEEARDGMAARAADAEWQGETASAARTRIDRVATAFGDGFLQARATRILLEDFLESLRSLKRRLADLEDTAAAHSLNIRDDGTAVTRYDFGVDHAEQFAADISPETRAAIEETTAGIQQILVECAHLDEVVARTLYDIAGEDRDTFRSPGTVGLEAGLHHDALRDAAEFVDLARRQEALTREELARLDELLLHHLDDQAFAEHLATGLGAEGLADFWLNNASYRMPGTGDRGSEEWRLLAGLQEHLGTVLGTATQSDSRAMEQWEADVITLAADGMPQGAQVMSALMRHGTYEPDFLTEYGDALIAYEQSRAETSPAVLWDSQSTVVYDFTGGEDLGHDPMAGFLTALGNNPDAATAYFQPPDGFDPLDEDSELNSRLRYLATDREWEGGQVPGDTRAALGDALLAAATGRPTADWENPLAAGTADLRTPETAAVMEQVIGLYGDLGEGGDPHLGLLGEQPEMAESLGRMAGAYMDDLMYLGGAKFSGTRDGFEDMFVPPYGDRLGNDPAEVRSFLSILGRDETAHRITTQAAYAYTLGNLDAHPPTSEAAYNEGMNSLIAGARVRELLDQGRVDQIALDFENDTEAAEEARARAGGWVKSTLNAGITAGLTAGAIAVSGGAGTILVPTVAASTGVFLGEITNQTTDSALDLGDQATAERESRMSAQEFYNAGVEEIDRLATRYYTLADEAGISTPEYGRYLQDLEEAYDLDME